jgi:hypothetical protein
MELPDFHIPHAEKIEWMIESNGWALEPVLADPDSEPPMPSYAYSIGMPGCRRRRVRSHARCGERTGDAGG